MDSLRTSRGGRSQPRRRRSGYVVRVSPAFALGSVTLTLNAMYDGLAGVPEIQYCYTVTSTATAGGSYGGGTWTQTTTNYAAIDYFMGVATETGHGQTTGQLCVEPALFQRVVVTAGDGHRV